MGGIEIDDEGAWIYGVRSFGESPDTPLHVQLQWILEQIHYDCVTVDDDEAGIPVTITLGRGASLVTNPPMTMDQAKKHAERCDVGLSLAALFAKGREEG